MRWKGGLGEVTINFIWFKVEREYLFHFIYFYYDYKLLKVWSGPFLYPFLHLSSLLFLFYHFFSIILFIYNLLYLFSQVKEISHQAQNYCLFQQFASINLFYVNYFNTKMHERYEYVLSVAEKIIRKSASTEILQKYLMIKKQMLTKYLSDHNPLAQLTNKVEKQNRKSYKSNRLSAQSTKSLPKFRQKDQHQIGNIYHENAFNGADLSHSKGESMTRKGQDKKEFNVIAQIATVLKNAEEHPSLLKSISFLPKTNRYVELETKLILEEMASNLNKIYEKLAEPILNEIQSFAIDTRITKAQPNGEEMIREMKWALEKLEILIEQNSILRRMVGKNN